MKLLLGCSTKIMEGWTGVDINPTVNPDIVDNIITLASIKNNTVTKIKCQHSFEHLIFKDAIVAIKNWRRVLILHGELSIEVPDLERCFMMIQSGIGKERQCGTNGIFGDIKSDNLHLLHKHAWSYESLTRVLSKLGFMGLQKKGPERRNKCTRFNRDMRVTAIKVGG